MFALTSLALLLPSLFSTATVAWPVKNSSHPSTRAAYVLLNDPEGAAIISFKVSEEDGLLSNPVKISTGGKGLNGFNIRVNGSAPVPFADDPLQSQDSVVVSGNYLFTINAGSDTLCMFHIPPENPQYPVLIGEPASTGAEFAQSVAYSPVLNTVCVLSGGAKAGVSCFSTHPIKGLTPQWPLLRPLYINETTPPTGPPGTASDITFNPSQTALVVSIKGNGKTPGEMYTYPVQFNGSLSVNPVLSQPSELLLDFSQTWLNETHMLITDPAYGSAIIALNQSTWEWTYTAKTVIPGEVATCWSQYAPDYDTVFVADVGTNYLSMVNPSNGELKGQFMMTAAKGAVDFSIDRSYLYATRTSAAIGVVSLGGWWEGLSNMQNVQLVDLSAFGGAEDFQGMAIYRPMPSPAAFPRRKSPGAELR